MFRPGTVIIDSGSTFNCFYDESLLTNVAPCDTLETYSSGGGMTYHQSGTISLFSELTAYVNPDCLVNIISLDILQQHYHTSFDSADSNKFVVDIGDRELFFEGFGSGLYVYNLNNTVNPYITLC